VDENGYFYIVDRTKDMINVSGYKVYSREIDDLLYGYPGVEHGATVGVPDPEREGSERVVVYVQPKAGYGDKISEQDIIEYLKSKIAKYAVPKVVKIIDEMPLTEVQKLDKKALRKRAADDFKVSR
jgi:acyl-CoA synthetase (AMP-forming)/AMP-acid ligase II